MNRGLIAGGESFPPFVDNEGDFFSGSLEKIGFFYSNMKKPKQNVDGVSVPVSRAANTGHDKLPSEVEPTCHDGDFIASYDGARQIYLSQVKKTVPAQAAKIKRMELPFDEASSGIDKENVAHYGDNSCSTDLWSISNIGGRQLLFEIVNSRGDRQEGPAYKTLFLRKAVSRYLRDALLHFAENQLDEKRYVINLWGEYQDDETEVDDILGKIRQGLGGLIKEIETWSET